MREKGGILGISITNIDFEPDSLVSGEDVEPGEYVQLVVTDTGHGMEPHLIKRVFEPFFTTKGVGEGTGMGLAVVYGVVKSLGGTIAVESEPEVGSTFRIFLPVARTDEKPEDSAGVQATPKGSERILFVDDEELIMEWGQAALERLGYTVTALTDSTEALDLFSSDPSALRSCHPGSDYAEAHRTAPCPKAPGNTKQHPHHSLHGTQRQRITRKGKGSRNQRVPHEAPWEAGVGPIDQETARHKIRRVNSYLCFSW